jgi:MerR family transcriptional regulator/heat shock protein HspR
VNLAGVEIILNMREKMAAMQAEMERFVAQLNTEWSRSLHPAAEPRTALVRVARPEAAPAAKKKSQK